MLNELLEDFIRDPDASWSCGRFGAIAEFHRDAGEPVEIATAPALTAATDRGAIRIERHPALRAVAYETISSCIESWGQGVALCLPRAQATMSGRATVTEIGPDAASVRQRFEHPSFLANRARTSQRSRIRERFRKARVSLP